MSSTTSYNNDKVVTGEVEYPATDPASGAFFHTDFKKNEDLKMMLDGSKDSLKLEAMKRIIGMIAKGRDASDLFPAVVKNVVSKNIEVKKLVYVYLVRYAEEQQDLALLSISTFQRALKEPNQLIRAGALRVLSSIRVSVIVPIVMLAIRDAASDMSPYVRKTAAHAIPKLYSLDPDQKEELVQVIDRLLSDKAPLVVGSAAMAFSEVCPDRITMLHRCYRKLCALLADVDEWGQLTLLNVLTVYARTCFPDPNNQCVSSDTDSDQSASSAPSLDPDHRLLLRAARPLLQSRNSGVVLAVAQLYYHAAPAQELAPVAKALVRLLRAPVEVQSVVLNCIASLTVKQPELFQPYLKSFFIRNSDPTHIKLLKLEIVSNIATESNAPVILRELQTVVWCGCPVVAAGTVAALGRLAATHAQPCLALLLRLLSASDERVVCEAVVVVKRVVGGGAAPAAAAVKRALTLLHTDRLAGAARAAALWLVAEHGAALPQAAHALAHMAKHFTTQEELVKLQILSLAVKLSICQPDTTPMCRYVATLARYDASYDVRDRARMLRRFIEPEGNKLLTAYAKEIFCPEKPMPVYTSNFKDRAQFTVGSLSQYVGAAASGFRPLPVPPPAPAPAALRDPPPDAHAPQDATVRDAKNKSFYSEPESSSASSSSSSEEDSSSEYEEDNKNEEDKKKTTDNGRSSKSASSDSESDSSSESESSEQSSDESEDDDEKEQDKTSKKQPPPTAPVNPPQRSNLELLLELDEAATGLPTMTPTAGGMITPAGDGGDDDDAPITPASPPAIPPPSLPLLPRVVGGGLLANYSWIRTPHLYSKTMVAVDVKFTNCTSDDVCNIRIGKKTLSGSRSMHDFPTVPVLPAGGTASCILGVDFADSIQPVEFTIASSLGECPVSITPPVGELLRAVTMGRNVWQREQLQLRGMNECDKKAPRLSDDAEITRRVYETANVAAVTSEPDLLRFAGRLLTSQDLVLVSVKLTDDSCHVYVNCQNMAIASLLANEVANAFSRG